MKYRVYFSNYKRPLSVDVEADSFDQAAELGKQEVNRVYAYHVVSPGEPIRIEAADRIPDTTRIHESYDVLSRSLNGGRGVDDVRDALAEEHSTLLGMLANAVLHEVRGREHDGRLCDLNAPLAEKVEHYELVSDVRQRLI